MKKRLLILTKIKESIRLNVISGMQRGLMKFPEDERRRVIRTQIGVLSEFSAVDRQIIMKAMDNARDLPPKYEQNRGMPKIPMVTFRGFMDNAFPQTLKENKVTLTNVTIRGYIWHFFIGSTFSVSYLMIFGSGSWFLALACGVFVWLGMMIAIPPMMPMIKFPSWFPIIPLIAHLVMMIPVGYIGLNILSTDAQALECLRY